MNFLNRVLFLRLRQLALCLQRSLQASHQCTKLLGKGLLLILRPQLRQVLVDGVVAAAFVFCHFGGPPIQNWGSESRQRHEDGRLVDATLTSL
ncbi:hypothetical protein [Paracoccus sp. T5]|uniref:hypothetical protein n=1 Tax=Paracoccus sp. T5 TaxID=3402161 RepID=UPI003AE21112